MFHLYLGQRQRIAYSNPLNRYTRFMTSVEQLPETSRGVYATDCEIHLGFLNLIRSGRTVICR